MLDILILLFQVANSIGCRQYVVFAIDENGETLGGSRFWMIRMGIVLILLFCLELKYCYSNLSLSYVNFLGHKHPSRILIQISISSEEFWFLVVI